MTQDGMYYLVDALFKILAFYLMLGGIILWIAVARASPGRLDMWRCFKLIVLWPYLVTRLP